jgi:cephalosporin hydroxylase
VGEGSYVIVLDTIVEEIPKDAYPDRPWGPGNNPMTAVDAFLRQHPRFRVDPEYDGKLLFTVAPRGYLLASADP